MPLDIIIGAQWGDEGKGRIVDLLAKHARYSARFSGGDNAGHTVAVAGQTHRLHLIPSGIVHEHTTCVIGNGVVVNPETLLDEIARLRVAGVVVDPGRLRISYAAHVITPAHLALDAAQEKARGAGAIGTTLRGIGPAYTSKVARSGLRMGEMMEPSRFGERVAAQVESINELLVNIYGAQPLNAQEIAAAYEKHAKELGAFIADTAGLLQRALEGQALVLAEGAQGTLLDLDHGTYPYVTSSNATAPAALSGLGIGLGFTGRVIGVTKCFQTRVGEGPFPTELDSPTADHLRGSGENPWDEYGTTTGRPRRVGWLDIPLLRYAVSVNGLTEIALTKLDVLTGLPALSICTAYDRQGERIHRLPMGLADLAPFRPVYETLPGWEEDLWDVRSFDQLPDQACDYILRIEDLVEVPVRIVSVGPGRDQVIHID